MEMRRKVISWLSVYLLLMACEEIVQRPLNIEGPNLLVVEGIITNEKINHRISISLPYASQNGSRSPVSGAVLKIKEGNTEYPVSESPAGSGNYFTEEMRAVFGKTYILSIQYKGKEYSAQDSPVPVEPLQTLNYEKVNDQYRLVLSDAGQDPNFVDHSISWSNTPSCISGTNCEGKILSYDLKTIDVNEIYKPKKADFTFPLNSIIIRKKYSVSPDYRSFLRSVLSETEWRGGVFDVQRANATTNLSEGAIGFFAVSTVVSDTTLIIKKP
jgi:Domain of unknown function (DUF4249)